MGSRRTELGTTKILRNLKNHKLFLLIKQMIYGLYEEFQEELPAKGLTMQSYFSLLFCGIYRLALEKSEKIATTDSRAAQHFRTFQRSMKQAYTPQKSINECAFELHITPVHLNRICQVSVGKSALQIIHDFLFLEAKNT